MSYIVLDSQLMHASRFMAGIILLGVSTSARAQTITLHDAQLIDEGFRIFTEEKFDGNGRTCATCHIPEAQYTIGPTDIAALNREDRALVLADNVPDLEEPVLVRELALFNTGETEVERVFRSSMTIAALDLTTANAGRTFPGPHGPQLGWAGDASPRDGVDHDNEDPAADGSVRAFANGAIAQHNTKRLARVAGVDFRFATDDELDALAAFQRWLGRRAQQNGHAELAFSTLTFSNADVEQGKAVFMTPQATCNDCHANGGANFTGNPPVPIVGGTNFNMETGVEAERARLSKETGVQIPADEGGMSTPPPNVASEHGAFNVQSLIEAPRKHAFFHNSAVVGDIEDAAAFYFTASFIESSTNIVFPDRAPHCDSLECLEQITPQALEKLGAFLRSVSAVYALIDCDRLLLEAIERIHIGASVEVPLKHCGFALHDIYSVLTGSHLSPPPYEHIAYSALALANKLDTKTCATSESDASDLEHVRSKITRMREAIATSPELPSDP